MLREDFFPQFFEKEPMKKVLFIGTGGTISSAGTAMGLAPALDTDALIANLPEITDLCEPSSLGLYSIDSSEMTPEHWLGMTKAIRDNYDIYDAFIICHGTDTMAYSAAALSYLIQDSPKPIILTGSQKPISFDITDAKKNLHDSLVCALSPDSAGVMIVFDGKIIAGTRAKKEKTYSFDAFASVNFPYLGYVRGNEAVYYLRQRGEKVKFYDRMDANVFVFKPTPGMPVDIIESLVRDYDCLIVECYGMGGLPKSTADKLAESLHKYPDCIIVMTTQVTYEGSNTGVYEVGRYIGNKFDYLEAHDMTNAALYTKVMWMLGNFDKEQARDIFYTPVGFDIYG